MRGLRIGVEGGVVTEDRDGNLQELKISRLENGALSVTDHEGNVFAPMRASDAYSYFADLLEELGFRVKASD
jgi:hypothetical protein